MNSLQNCFWTLHRPQWLPIRPPKSKKRPQNWAVFEPYLDSQNFLFEPQKNHKNQDVSKKQKLFLKEEQNIKVFQLYD